MLSLMSRRCTSASSSFRLLPLLSSSSSSSSSSRLSITPLLQQRSIHNNTSILLLLPAWQKMNRISIRSFATKSVRKRKKWLGPDILPEVLRDQLSQIRREVEHTTDTMQAHRLALHGLSRFTEYHNPRLPLSKQPYSLPIQTWHDVLLLFAATGDMESIRKYISVMNELKIPDSQWRYIAMIRASKRTENIDQMRSDLSLMQQHNFKVPMDCYEDHFALLRMPHIAKHMGLQTTMQYAESLVVKLMRDCSYISRNIYVYLLQIYAMNQDTVSAEDRRKAMGWFVDMMYVCGYTVPAELINAMMRLVSVEDLADAIPQQQQQQQQQQGDARLQPELQLLLTLVNEELQQRTTTTTTTTTEQQPQQEQNFLMYRRLDLQHEEDHHDVLVTLRHLYEAALETVSLEHTTEVIGHLERTLANMKQLNKKQRKTALDHITLYAASICASASWRDREMYKRALGFANRVTGDKGMDVESAIEKLKIVPGKHGMDILMKQKQQALASSSSSSGGDGGDVNAVVVASEQPQQPLSSGMVFTVLKKLCLPSSSPVASSSQATTAMQLLEDTMNTSPEIVTVGMVEQVLDSLSGEHVIPSGKSVVKDVYRILSKMETLDLQPTGRIYESCIPILAREFKSPEPALKLEESMRRGGIVPGLRAFRFWLLACARHDRQDLVDKIWKNMSIYDIQPDERLFNTLVFCCLQNNYLQLAMERLFEMDQKGFVPSQPIVEQFLGVAEQTVVELSGLLQGDERSVARRKAVFENLLSQINEFRSDMVHRHDTSSNYVDETPPAMKKKQEIQEAKVKEWREFMSEEEHRTMYLHLLDALSAEFDLYSGQ